MTDWNAGVRSARLPVLRMLAGAAVGLGLIAVLLWTGEGHQAIGIVLVAVGVVLAVAAEVVRGVAAHRPR